MEVLGYGDFLSLLVRGLNLFRDMSFPVAHGGSSSPASSPTALPIWFFAAGVVAMFVWSWFDKSDEPESEIGTHEDGLIPEEIFKSYLASIKRVCSSVCITSTSYFLYVDWFLVSYHTSMDCNFREEEAIFCERKMYELEKGQIIRVMKRIRDEDGSRFNNFPVLNKRYALLNLLGKGIFSEIYKAYDLVDHRYIACKLHGLNAKWSEEKKQSYLRHAMREYDIHKSLVHHQIVRLWDTFQIDLDTFFTVLEYCSGKDLDVVLKAINYFSEK